MFIYLTEFAKRCPQRTQRQSRRPDRSDQPPGLKIGPSRMHVAPTTPAVCHFDTESSNQLKQLSKTPSNTVNNKII